MPRDLAIAIGLSRSSAFASLSMALLSLFSAPPAQAAIISWDGSCGNDFWTSVCGSMTNWNNDQQPTLGDQVSIGPGDPVVNIVFDAQASSLTCESGLWIDAALELAGSGAIRDLTLSSIAQRALKINAGQVTLTGTTNWEQGRVGGAGVLRNESMMTGYMQMVDTSTFVNATQATMHGGSIDTNAVAINSQGALFTLQSPAVGSQISLSGAGMFVNHGTLEHQHLANTIIHMDCPYLQDTGNFDVNTTSAANASTHFRHSATFSGGEFTIAGDGHVYFLVPGAVGGIYTFDGLPSVTGAGNLHLSTPTWGDVRVTSDLNVNLTGTDGLVLDGIYTSLGAALINQGKAKLVRSTIRPISPLLADGIDIPQLTNESGATMRLVAPGIATDVWLRNKAGGTFVHEVGGLGIDDNGVVTNEGTYEHRRGSIYRASGATFGSFDNCGIYVRPDHPNTMNEQVSAPFVLSPGSIARYEQATTEYAGGIGSGTFFLGGNMEIWDGAVVRVGGGSCEQANSLIAGLGQFHFGGWIGPAINFNIEDERVLLCNLGPDFDDLARGGGEAGGAYLDQQSRIGGPGELRNLNQLFWNGGSIGSNGEGRVRNAVDAATFLTFGFVAAGGEFINEGFTFLPLGGQEGFPPPAGLVRQNGTLTLQDGYVTNDGYWLIETGSTIQGSGLHEFLNSDIGLFQNVIPAAQTTSVTARFNNLGLVHAVSGTLAFSNVTQVSGNTLSGGWWKVDQGATLDLPGILTTIGIGARVDCDGTFNDLNTVLVNLGDLTINDGSFNQSLTNSGVMGVNTGDDTETTTIQNGNGNLNNQPHTALYYANTQVVPSIAGGEGGPIPFDLRCANFNNSGLVGPGGPGGVGPFKIDGNFNQSSPDAVLQIDLAGETAVGEHDQLIVDGNVTLDGHVHVRVLPGFAPEGGEQFTIITASNGIISGTFDQIDGHGQYSVAYSPTSVTLTLIAPPQPGDTNGDGSVDVDDLINVILGWGACPAPPTFCDTDLDGNGAVDVDDLITVILNWG